MYVSMLEEAIAKAQNKEVERDVSIDPAIDLEVDAFSWCTEAINELIRHIVELLFRFNM